MLGRRLTYGPDLVRDIRDRTETAMPQERCFKAMELALKAQALAENEAIPRRTSDAGAGDDRAVERNGTERMPKVWNVGVVGSSIGRSHIVEGYARDPEHFRVLALCDLNEERLKRSATSSASSAASRPSTNSSRCREIDIVDVCTPPGLHVPMAEAALRAGKHVGLREAARELARRGRSTRRGRAGDRQAPDADLPVPLRRRRHEGEAHHRSGLAGKPYLATVETAWNRKPEYYAVPWRGKWETELGGVLVTHAIHLHDMLTFLMGPVASVFCRTATRVNAIEVEDCAAISLVMEMWRARDLVPRPSARSRRSAACACASRT